MTNYKIELIRIFGSKYQGCRRSADELIDYWLKPGEVATPEELAQVEALPKGIRAEIDELKVEIKALKER